ncbi:MAG: hypothetical protein AABX83_02605 [Nanoarchaeota archaeon]
MEKLQANLVLEILGRPKEHVTEALNELVNKLGTEKGIKIIEKKLHEPISVKDANELFTTFAHVLVELDSLENYFGIMFAYMPSNFEIINPEKMMLSNVNLNELAGKLIERLHNYDAITKKALMDNEILAKKLHEVAPHLFKQQENTQTTEVKKKETKVKKTRKKK